MSDLKNDTFDEFRSPKKVQLKSSLITGSLTPQITPSTPFTGTSFIGNTTFPFQVGTNYAWIPHKSYLEIDFTVHKYDGAGAEEKVALSSDIGLAYDVGSAMFTSMSLQLGSDEVSNIKSMYTQISVMKRRATKPEAFNKSFRNSLSLASEYQTRQNELAYQGFALDYDQSISLSSSIGETKTVLTPAAPPDAAYNTITFTQAPTIPIDVGSAIVRNAQTHLIVAKNSATEYKSYETFATDNTGRPTYLFMPIPQPSHRSNSVKIWHTPALDVFDESAGCVLPSGNWQLNVSTYNDEKTRLKSMIESDAQNYVEGKVANGVVIDVKSVKFYPYLVEVAAPEMKLTKRAFRYNTRQWECRALDYKLAGENEVQSTTNKNMDQIIIATQAKAIGTDMKLSPTRFSYGNFDERLVTSLSVQALGTVKPSPARTVLWSTESDGITRNDKFRSLHYATFNELGMADRGCENYYDYMNLGWFAAINFPKSRGMTDPSIVVRISTTSASTDRSLLIFSVGERILDIEQDGSVVKVSEASIY